MALRVGDWERRARGLGAETAGEDKGKARLGHWGLEAAAMADVMVVTAVAVDATVDATGETTGELSGEENEI